MPTTNEPNVLILHLVWNTPQGHTEIDIITKPWGQHPPHSSALWLLIRSEFVYLERTLSGARLANHIAHIRNRITGEEIQPYATA
jgi:hypothetical protein